MSDAVLSLSEVTVIAAAPPLTPPAAGEAALGLRGRLRRGRRRRPRRKCHGSASPAPELSLGLAGHVVLEVPVVVFLQTFEVCGVLVIGDAGRDAELHVVLCEPL